MSLSRSLVDSESRDPGRPAAAPGGVMIGLLKNLKECVSSVYFEGHRAKPLAELNRRAPKGRPNGPPPVVRHPESLADQAAYTEALLPGSG